MILNRCKLIFAAGLILAVAVVSVGNDSRIAAQEKTLAVKKDEFVPPTPTPELQKRIDQLIAQLAADGFDEREQAQKDLEKIGLPALESLRKAKKNPEAEIARRAADLVARLEELAKSSTQLAPKKVTLKLKDVSVLDALADLSKQSGYPIQIGGDKTKLGERKITLDTGETTFWEAFDQLCLKGGLVEAAPEGAMPVGSLHVVAGTPKPMATSYSGALRLRVIADSVKRKDGVAEFMIELSVEPRFRMPKVLGAARIDTALDDQGKALAALASPTEKPTAQRAPAALKLGDRQTTLKELSGTVLFETIMADKLLAIEDLAKSVGKSVKNDEGASLRLDSYTRKENGEVTLRATLTKQFQRMGPVVINQETFKEFQPELLDANGLPFQIVSSPGNGISLSGTTISLSKTINFRPAQGSGEPAQLSLTSDKKTALSVPFSFKNLTLP